MLSITTVFNTDHNKKCSLSIKSAYEISERLCDSEDWSKNKKINISEIIYIFMYILKNILKKKSRFKL